MTGRILNKIIIFLCNRCSIYYIDMAKTDSDLKVGSRVTFSPFKAI